MFTTSFARFFPTMGPFDLTSLPEIFNKRMDTVITGVVTSMDDFLVFGKTKQFTDHGATLNKAKYVFYVTEVEFVVHWITPDGIQPIIKKLHAIKDFKVPINITQLSSAVARPPLFHSEKEKKKCNFFL